MFPEVSVQYYVSWRIVVSTQCGRFCLCSHSKLWSVTPSSVQMLHLHTESLMCKGIRFSDILLLIKVAVT